MTIWVSQDQMGRPSTRLTISTAAPKPWHTGSFTGTDHSVSLSLSAQQARKMPQSTMALHCIQLTLSISLQCNHRTKDFVSQGKRRNKNISHFPNLKEILPKRKQFLHVFSCKWQQVINFFISHVIC